LIVSLVAPAGYGKTTLLSQRAEYNCQTFAWVSIDERESDASASLTSSVAGSVIPRLNAAFWVIGSGSVNW
jgi:ATP/maltotriose-dependent transcriptional regulator MalT